MKLKNELIFGICRSVQKSENKRPIEVVDDNDDQSEKRKKLKLEDGAERTTESILDDIHLDEIESRIEVHVIETPEACTHEVAVYPGNWFAFNRPIKLYKIHISKCSLRRSTVHAIGCGDNSTSQRIQIRFGSISKGGNFVH